MDNVPYPEVDRRRARGIFLRGFILGAGCVLVALTGWFLRDVLVF